MLAGGGSAVKCEDMDQRQDILGKKPYFLPSFGGVCSIPGTVYFSRSSLQQDDEIPMEAE